MGGRHKKMSEATVAVTKEYKETAKNLLFQLADDDFLFSYRGSEWLGLAPHIEEDIAYSSITQDSMGHANMYYQLLEKLGLEKADLLAHLRPAADRKNSVLVERPNGEGYYMDVEKQNDDGTSIEVPHYDWAFTVVRNYFYTSAKKVKIDSLKNSSYQPLAEAAVKVNTELYYHLLHWKTWFVQLLNSTEEAKQRMHEAIEKVSSDLGDLFSLGNAADNIVEFGLIEKESVLIEHWKKQVEPVFQSIQLQVPEIPGSPALNGRNGEHTNDLQNAIEILSEVLRLDPAVAW
jgi:ring-1,2-phenylacetyl-CoA epoxidase subunit PaaC